MKNTLDLMRQYCEESGEKYEAKKVRKEIAEYEKVINKSFLEMEEWEIREMFATFRDQKKTEVSHITAKAVINDYIGFYSRFFDWCIEKGILQGTNIFLLRSLSSREVHKMLTERYQDEIPVLLKEEAFNEICAQCGKIFENGFYPEIILRLLYEGVIYRIDDVKEIKEDQVFFGQNSAWIHYKNRRFDISEALAKLLKSVREDSFVLANRSLEVKRIDNSYLYFVCKKGCGNDHAISASMRQNFFKPLSDRTGVKITSDYIYYSGFYNFLLKKTKYNEEKVYDMFYDGHYAINSIVKELTRLAGEFGCPKEGKHIRTSVAKYRIR